MATKEEMLFAMQAVRLHLVSRAQVESALETQKRFDQEGKSVELARILVKSGALGRGDFERLRQAMATPGADVSSVDVVPGYRIRGRLGTGGMANVHDALREEDGLEVALKVLFPMQARHPRYLQLFLAEARLLSRLDCHQIARGYDHGFTGERYFMALELVRGPTVLSMLETHGRLPVAFACHVVVEVARALEHIAGQGLVHRDIKPGNVLVTASGQVKLVDLGFATRAHKSEPGDPEGGGASQITCGTVEYISPEQARGEHDIDIRSDIYSLGASFYHMVVGEPPFSGADANEIMAKQVSEGLSRAVQEHGVPRPIHFLIEKMMAKDPAQRFQSPREIIDGIGGLVAGLPMPPIDRLVAAVTASKAAPEVPVLAPAAAPTPKANVPTLKPTSPGVVDPARRPRPRPPSS